MFRTTALLAVALGCVHARVAAPPPMEVSQVVLMGPDPRFPDSGAGDTGASQDRYVDMHMGFSQMYPGMRVWGDILDSKWRSVPDWMMGFSTMLPSSITSAWRRVEWHCAPEKYTGSPYCDAYVFIYHCPGCAFRDGNLAPNLIAEGWQPFRCTPIAEVSPTGPPHRMMGFYQRVPAGSIAAVVLTEETGLTSYAINRAGNDCGDYGDQGSCNSPSLRGQCAWIEGSCKLAQCTQQGPFPPTETCADRICLPQEIAAI